MRALTTLAAAAAVTAGLITATAPTASAGQYGPTAAVRVGNVDTEGRTPVRVMIDNRDNARKATVEISRGQRHRYVTVKADTRRFRLYYLTPRQRVRFVVRYLDARIAAKRVRGEVPTRPTATLGGRERAGVGTLATFLYRNPTDSPKRFRTSVWLGDGSGEVNKRVRVPANSTRTWGLQIGETSADVHLRVGRRTLMSRFIQPLR